MIGWSIGQLVGRLAGWLVVTYRNNSAALYITAPDGCPQRNFDRGYIYAKPEFGKCYHFVDVEKYYPDAQSYCSDYGGNLVTVSQARRNYSWQ